MDRSDPPSEAARAACRLDQRTREAWRWMRGFDFGLKGELKDLRGACAYWDAGWDAGRQRQEAERS